MAAEPTLRRNFLRSALAAAAGLVLGKKVLAEDKPEPAPSSLFTEGDVLRTHVKKGSPPVQPLDSMMVFERSDDNNGRAMTHEVLSLIHEEKGKKSYPWTLYAGLETHHEEGDACVTCARLTKQGPGWSTATHSEIFNHGRAVGIGHNIEISNYYTGPDSVVVGQNIQVLGPQPCKYGIQIHGQGTVEAGLAMNGKGDVGIDFGGKYGTGIHTHGNSIRVSEGTCIELEDTGKIRVRYSQGRIEFLNGDKCIGHIKTDAADHEF